MKWSPTETRATSVDTLELVELKAGEEASDRAGSLCKESTTKPVLEPRPLDNKCAYLLNAVVAGGTNPKWERPGLRTACRESETSPVVEPGGVDNNSSCRPNAPMYLLKPGLSTLVVPCGLSAGGTVGGARSWFRVALPLQEPVVVVLLVEAVVRLAPSGDTFAAYSEKRRAASAPCAVEGNANKLVLANARLGAPPVVATGLRIVAFRPEGDGREATSRGHRGRSSSPGCSELVRP